MNSRKKDKIINIDKKENTQIPALHVSFNPKWRFSWLFNVFDILLAVSLTFFKNDFNISHAHQHQHQQQQEIISDINFGLPPCMFL